MRRNWAVGAALAVGMLAAQPSVAADLDKGTRQLVADVLKQAPVQGKRLAVCDFTDAGGNVSELSMVVAQGLETALMRDATGKGFRLLDRHHLDSLKKEWKLGSYGLVALRLFGAET